MAKSPHARTRDAAAGPLVCLNSKCGVPVERGAFCDACWHEVPYYLKASWRALKMKGQRPRGLVACRQFLEGRLRG